MAVRQAGRLMAWFLMSGMVVSQVGFSQKATKVACIGDSITFGSRIENRAVNCYPAKLQKFLGNSYEVQNFGLSGRTLLKKGDRPYWKEKAYKQVLAYNPNIVIIKLGTNDAKPQNWKHNAEFAGDLEALTHSFKNLSSKPKLFLAYPVPVEKGKWGINEKTVKEEIIPIVKAVADKTGASILDFYKAVPVGKKLFADGVHPNAAGAELMAKAAFTAITGKTEIPEFIETASIFSSHMVLQRNKPVPVWGFGKVGEAVTVKFSGQTKSTKVEAAGRWLVTLDPMKTSATGQVMTILSDGRPPIELKNILIGEVWVCSGQSNMEWPLHKNIEGSAKAIAEANYPNLRLFNVARATSPTPKADCSGSWAMCTPKSAKAFSATAFFFGRTLVRDLKNVPIGLITTAWGGTPAQAWTEARGLTVLDEFKNGAPKFKRIGPHTPSALYNGMINPLVPLAIRGAIWYQGESDTRYNASRYRKLFPSMISSWRKAFNQGDFPFYLVQIAPFKYRKGRDGVGIREIQRETLSLVPKTGMACIMDKATLTNIHPPYKTEVGDRLALWALAKDYGQDVVYSGPNFREYTIEGRSVRVIFDYAKGLTTKDKKLTTFELAGNDGKWHKATAKIDGNTIVVTSDAVAEPVNVRYAWHNEATAELWNAAGLPASSFRSDKW